MSGWVLLAIEGNNGRWSVEFRWFWNIPIIMASSGSARATPLQLFRALMRISRMMDKNVVYRALLAPSLASCRSSSNAEAQELARIVKPLMGPCGLYEPALHDSQPTASELLKQVFRNPDSVRVPTKHGTDSEQEGRDEAEGVSKSDDDFRMGIGSLAVRMATAMIETSTPQLTSTDLALPDMQGIEGSLKVDSSIGTGSLIISNPMTTDYSRDVRLVLGV